MNAVNKVLQKSTQKLIDRRKAYKKSVNFESSNSELNFKKLPNDEFEILKEEIKINAKKDKQLHAVALFIIVLMVLGVFYYLFSDFSIDFTIFSRHR
ncbi:MAG: hypothetical protein ACPGU6_01260 [Tenacibaculum sp.]